MTIKDCTIRYVILSGHRLVYPCLGQVTVVQYNCVVKLWPVAECVNLTATTAQLSTALAIWLLPPFLWLLVAFRQATDPVYRCRITRHGFKYHITLSLAKKKPSVMSAGFFIWFSEVS
jgi:hypothetical protein